jgi:hypothetical protein
LPGCRFAVGTYDCFEPYCFEPYFALPLPPGSMSSRVMRLESLRPKWFGAALFPEYGYPWALDACRLSLSLLVFLASARGPCLPRENAGAVRQSIRGEHHSRGASKTVDRSICPSLSALAGIARRRAPQPKRPNKLPLLVQTRYIRKLKHSTKAIQISISANYSIFCFLRAGLISKTRMIVLEDSG